MKKAPSRFHKLLKFVKNERGQAQDQAMAEKQSPQSANIPDLQPGVEAEMVVKKRKALQKKEGRPLYE